MSGNVHVSISLFGTKLEKHQGLSLFLEGRSLVRARGSKTLLIVGSDVMEIDAFARVRQGHIFRRRDREAASSRVPYLFVDRVAFSGASDEKEFEVVSFHPDMMVAVAVVEAAAFHFYLTRSEFVRIQRDVPARFHASFRFEQHAAFPSLYDRRSVDLLGEMGLDDQELPFPDGRHLSSEVLHRIREWGEVEPCELCRAVPGRGMPVGFCFRPFEECMRDHLAHQFDDAILSQIVESGDTGKGSNL
jgi:hypothetical protein